MSPTKLIFLILILSVTIGSSLSLSNQERPLQWMSTGHRVSSGLQRYNIIHQFMSPCDSIESGVPADFIGSSLFNESRKTCQRYYGTHWLVPLLSQQNRIKNTRTRRSVLELSDFGQSVLSSAAGEIWGHTASYMVKTTWERVDPNSTSNRAYRNEHNIELLHEAMRNFQREFNISREIEQKTLKELQSLASSVAQDEKNIARLTQLTPSLSYLNGYIINGILQSTSDFRSIVSHYLNSKRYQLQTWRGSSISQN